MRSCCDQAVPLIGVAGAPGADLPLVVHVRASFEGGAFDGGPLHFTAYGAADIAGGDGSNVVGDGAKMVETPAVAIDGGSSSKRREYQAVW